MLVWPAPIKQRCPSKSPVQKVPDDPSPRHFNIQHPYKSPSVQPSDLMGSHGQVSRLRGSLWWFTTSPATPAASELWSGASSASSHRPSPPPAASPRASGASHMSGASASAPSSKRQSVHSLRSTSSKDSEPRARRRATRSALQEFHRFRMSSLVLSSQ